MESWTNDQFAWKLANEMKQRLQQLPKVFNVWLTLNILTYFDGTRSQVCFNRLTHRWPSPAIMANNELKLFDSWHTPEYWNHSQITKCTCDMFNICHSVSKGTKQNTSFSKYNASSAEWTNLANIYKFQSSVSEMQKLFNIQFVKNKSGCSLPEHTGLRSIRAILADTYWQFWRTVE